MGVLKFLQIPERSDGEDERNVHRLTHFILGN